jgi:hypothetical protein
MGANLAIERICLVVDPGFFLLLNPDEGAGKITDSELTTLIGSAEKGHVFSPHPIRYLFGVGSFDGLLKLLAASGCRFEIYEEGFFRRVMSGRVPDCDHFDFQFARGIPDGIIEKLLSNRRTVSGWCPIHFSGKHFQAAILQSVPATAGLLPYQLYVAGAGDLQNEAFHKFVDWFPSEFLVVKGAYGADNKMLDGSEYFVFNRRNWERFARYAMERPAWFISNNGLLISELIETADPFLGNANNVVHKVHIPSALPAREKREWPLDCIRAPHQLQLECVGDEIKPLSEISVEHQWQLGSLDSYRETLMNLAEVIFPLPRLFCFDMMCRPNGELRFLEANYHPGTLAHPEIYGAKSPTPLEFYYHWLLSQDFDAVEQSAALQHWRNHAGRVLWEGS